MLEIQRAIQDGTQIYRTKFVALFIWVLPVLIAQDLSSTYIAQQTLPGAPWLPYALTFFSDGVLGTFAIYIGISICLSPQETAFTLTNLRPGKLLVLGVSTLFMSVAFGLGLLLLVLPGLAVITLSFFYPIYIVAFNQGPIEALASSAAIAKKVWPRLSLLLLMLIGIWMVVNWLGTDVILPLANDTMMFSLFISAFLSVLHMYSYAITVSTWRQITKHAM